MLLTCWSAKGGSGTTVVAVSLSLLVARRSSAPAVLLDLALPAIDRGHGRQDVDARGETLVDQRARDRDGVGVSAESGEHDGDGRGRRLSHCFFLVLFDRECYLPRVLVIKTRYSATAQA